jgi:hypothetical protein
VKVFLLPVETVLEDWSEASLRKRQWLDVTKAIKRVKKTSIKQILKTSKAKLRQSGEF